MIKTEKNESKHERIAYISKVHYCFMNFLNPMNHHSPGQ